MNFRVRIMQWQLVTAIIFVTKLCFFVVTSTPVTECPPPSFFKCHGTDKCISQVFVCDGDNDCGDASDETPERCRKEVPSFAEACKEHEFQCADRFHCIPEDDYCDGKKDCIDGSDEVDDCHRDQNCNGFKCASGQCIQKSWVCDDARDCRDGSDELNCTSRNNVSPANCNSTIDKHLCANRQRCIDLTLVCNNVDDCGDESDEHPANCSRAVEACSSSPCSSICRPTPEGYQCACAAGYILKNHVCEDINECNQRGLCDQGCINTLGSYYCQCETGYTLQDDKRSCKSEYGEALMIFATKTSIRGYYLDSMVYFSIADNLQHVVGVSLDANHIYWSDIKLGEETMFRSLDDGTKREAIVTTGLGCPEDITVDWITGNFYFTDSMYKHIGVCNDNGNYCTIVVNENIDKPRGIVVVPSRGKMYWSDWGENPHIAVSFMDGTKGELFVKENLGWPNGLTIDVANDRLYWVDAKLKVIESIRLDGVDRRMVLHDVAKHPYSIAVFGNRLYWSDWSTESIHSCNKFTGKDFTTLVQKNETLYGINIYHPTLMAKYANPCVAKPCSQLCLLSENRSYSCACAMDKQLEIDGHKCGDSMKRKHIVIAAGNTIVNYHHEVLGKPKVTSSVVADHIGAMTYDPLKDTLIVADNMKHSIFRFNPNSLQTNPIPPIVDEVIECISFDYLGNNLYKTNVNDNKIEVQSLTTGEKTEFSYSKNPFDIVVVPKEGIMFVLFRSYNQYHIDRAQMNGQGARVRVVEGYLHGSKISMTYDQDTKRVFWTDEGTGRIESMDSQGHNRKLLRTGITSPVGIVILDSDVFWISRGSTRLSWTDKKQGASIKELHIDIERSVDVPLLQSIDGPYTGARHPCSRNNGDCSHVCLVTDAANRLCACPTGYIISSNMNTCRLNTTCSDNEIKCANSDKCIPQAQVCNGVHDCPDGEDEDDCPTSDPKACDDRSFKCGNGFCIPRNWECDGQADCTDASDEHESCPPIECADNTFSCHNGHCVDELLECNGIDNCGDNSDEEHCVDRSTTNCTETQFTCTSGRCIPLDKVCDGIDDCTDDGSDEGGSCDTACSVNSCEDVCYSTPNGGVCGCRRGYKLAADGKSCVGAHECEQPDVCAQHCTNRSGSVVCSCYEGYRLRFDGISCMATGPAMRIVTTTVNDIRIIVPNQSSNPPELLFYDEKAEINGLDVNARDGTVYWSNKAFSTINKISMDRGNLTQIHNVLSEPQLLVVDWITDNVYVYDAVWQPSIKVCNFESKKCSEILHRLINKVTAMAIHPIAEILFFATHRHVFKSPAAEIVRTNLIGSDKVSIIKGNVGFVSGIAVDHHRNLVYWTDSYKGVIECADFDGKSRKIVVENMPSRPIGLFLFEDALYWKSEDFQVLNKRALYGNTNQTLEVLSGGQVNHMFVISQVSMQPTATNPCAYHTCRELCVVSEGQPVCLCCDGVVTRMWNDTAYEGKTNGNVCSAGNGSLWFGLVCGLLVVAMILGIYYFYVRTKRPNQMYRPNLENPVDGGIRLSKWRFNNSTALTTSDSVWTRGRVFC